MNRYIIALLLAVSPAFADFHPGGAVAPDGKTTVTCDIPAELRLHNTGGIGPRGPGSGSGLCVFTSLEHAGRYQNEPALWGLQKYMTSRPGGGYPQKVDTVLKAYAPGVVYAQHTGGDEAFLKLALLTGRMVSVTYNGRDDFYRGPIAHMINLLYLDDSQACVLDNNREKVYVWMTREEFLSRWRGGSGWAVVILHSPPAPKVK